MSKQLLFGLLVCFATTLASPIEAQSQWYDSYDFASKGVSAYWPLDGNANDVTGNGNDGIVNGPVPATGKLGQAYDFDGADDHIQMTDTRLMDSYSVLTMACWIKADSFDNANSYLIARTGQDGEYGPASLSLTGPNFAVFSISTAWDESQSVGSAAVSTVATGTWYHVAGTYDGATMRLFINGAQVAEAPKSPAGDLVTNDELLFIGSNDNYGFDAGFDGIIDDALIFNRALSAAEIADLASDADSSGVMDFWEDADGDGMRDTWESEHGVDDPAADPDQDGLTNLEEYQNSTNPRDADSDDDGTNDGDEMAAGTDPTDPSSYPPREGWDGTVYVDKDNTAGPWNGWSWTAALQTIQQGVDAVYAAGGGEVWVAAGTYTDTIAPVITMKENVHLYGGFAGSETDRAQRDWTVHVTTIDGEDTRRGVLGASNATIDGFTVTRGNAGSGGGMYNQSCSPTVSNCVFTSSSAGEGGGMKCQFSSATVTNCIFANNSSQGWGGGFENNNGTPTLTNCTFFNNSSIAEVGGGIYSEYQTTTVINCIFWNNSPTQIGGGVSVTYCDVQGGYSGEGNIDADPLFLDVANGDYHLSMGSPCIDSGTNAGAPANDIDGDLRPYNGTVDMGADEYTGDGPFDSDGDGLSDDDEEAIYGTDPNNPDTDNDGLSDGEEVYTYGTNPMSTDTDGDGFDDGTEVAAGTNPLDDADYPSPGVGVCVLLDPTDAGVGDPLFLTLYVDGVETDLAYMRIGGEEEWSWEEIPAVIPALTADMLAAEGWHIEYPDEYENFWEYTDGGTFADAIAAGRFGDPSCEFWVDSDGDGMPDGWEVENGLDPTVPDGDEDHDNDGLPNGYEYDIGSDPTDPSSPPRDLYVASDGDDDEGLGALLSPWATIARAMAAASIYTAAHSASIYHPETIHVAEGVYEERIEFVPDVTIAGAGTGATKIQYFNASDDDHVVVTAAENTAIRGCTITLPGIVAAVTVLVRIDDVVMEVADCVVDGRDNLFSIGVLISGVDSSASLIRDSVIRYVQYGIQAVDTGVNITDNLFEGIRDDAVYVRPFLTKMKTAPPVPLLGDATDFRTGFNRFRHVLGRFVTNMNRAEAQAEMNDWGVYTAPEIAAKIFGPVDFEPYIGMPTPVPGDVNSTGEVDAQDVQLVINEALGIDMEGSCDLDGNGSVDAVDVQLVINAVLGVV